MASEKRIKISRPISKQANALLRKLGRLERNARRIGTSADAKMAKLVSAATAKLQPIEAEMYQTFFELKALADGNRTELTDKGATKTVAFSAGTVNWRETPAKIDLTIDEIKLLAYLKRKGPKAFVRIRSEIDKAAMLKNPESAKKVPGVRIATREIFYAKPKRATAELSEQRMEKIKKS